MLADAFRPLGLRELAQGLERGSDLSRAVVITFDDGYRDNLSAAKPALERHGFPATVFIVSGYVDSSRDFWWDELLQLWQDSELRELRDYRAVWSDLRSLPHLERQAALDELWERHASRRPDPVTDILTSEDIVALADGGLVEVGAHTVTHPRLAGLPRDDQLEEIRSSKQLLEQLIGRRVESFSYPYGEYDRASVASVRAAGFPSACATGQRAVTGRSSPLEIPRIHVPDVPGDEFERMLEARLRS